MSHICCVTVLLQVLQVLLFRKFVSDCQTHVLHISNCLKDMHIKFHNISYICYTVILSLPCKYNLDKVCLFWQKLKWIYCCAISVKKVVSYFVWMFFLGQQSRNIVKWGIFVSFHLLGLNKLTHIECPSLENSNRAHLTNHITRTSY